MRFTAVAMSGRESTRVPSRSKTTAAGLICGRVVRTVRESVAGSIRLDPLGDHALRQDPGVVPAIEQALDGATTDRTVVARPLVDVHPDETVGALRVVLEAARIAHGVVQRLLPVVQAVG